MKKRKKKRRRSTDLGSYVCCGEQIVIPVDPSGGSEQHYVEDCPVCCNPTGSSTEQPPLFPDKWETNLELWKLASPVTHITKTSPPTLIL